MASPPRSCASTPTCSQIRVAVLDALPAADPSEAIEGSDETNAVLRWLRQRLSRHVVAPQSLRLDVAEAEPATRGTPAAEAALRQAARLAGPLPVGSHHLLLAALDDTNSAASWALASLGVDLDELREKLRSARVAGTTDEQPEQAGRRQMSIQVTGENLTIVLTDPVIVEAGQEALRAVNARAAAAKSAGEASSGEDAPAEEAGGKSATATVIQGDDPHAAGLADVWLELRTTLRTLADPSARTRRVVVAVRPPGSAGPADQAEPSEESEPDEPGAATS